MTATVITPFIATVMVIWIFFPVYWYFEPPALSDNIPTGMTEDGHPWIGDDNAELVITEFTDYLCFQCNKMHYYLRKLMVKYPGKIKIVHRHFPMDNQVNPLVKQPLHVGGGALAMFAIYAGTRGERTFWQMNDLLFSVARTTEKIDIEYLAEAVGLEPGGLAGSLKNPDIWNRLKKDLTDGFKNGVDGTPTFIIEGKPYKGQIPPEIISRLIE